MPKRSAGLIMYRSSGEALELLLVHPGGPFWAKKDAGAWSIAKGEVEDGEQYLEAAQREFQEETGFPVQEPFLALGEVKQGGKTISAWAFRGDCDPTKLVSNACEIQWPPRSGQKLTIPEIDRCQWFPIEVAKLRIVSAQLPFLERLTTSLRPPCSD